MIITVGTRDVTIVTHTYPSEIARQSDPCWEGVNTYFSLMPWRGHRASRSCVFGKVHMRNPLGLILGCVVAAVMIAAGWLFATSLRGDQPVPQAMAAKAASPQPSASSAKLASRDSTNLTKDDLDITGSLSGVQAAPPAPLALPAPQKSACANPDA